MKFLTIPLLAASLTIAVGSAAEAQQRCTFLQPIGGNGVTPIVSKQVGRGKLIGRENMRPVPSIR
jgi:hypothetical protein